MLRTFAPGDEAGLLALWNDLGTAMGYVPMTQADLHKYLLDSRDFSPERALLLEKGDALTGFALGRIQGNRGHIACILAGSEEDAALLVSRLEDIFRAAGCRESMVSFWCPIRLPWIIPGTGGHQHNNVPGAALDWPLHGWLESAGYQSQSREVAFHLDLGNFQIPREVLEKERRMAREGYTVAPFDPENHWGLQEMLEALTNPLWQEEIPAAVSEGKLMLVGLEGNQVAGFAGPVYPEKTGRGFFSGIGVAPEFGGHGLGTLLFYRLCQAQKDAGAVYMSLFTGAENPARRIYEGAGFTPCREFDVMRKALK